MCAPTSPNGLQVSTSCRQRAGIASRPHLNPIRIDKQQGASYEIPAQVFQEIDQTRIADADLSDEKPNVYCELGYEKSKGIPFILTFHKGTPATGPSWKRKSLSGNKCISTWHLIGISSMTIL